ncbi:MAG: hypothetical protein JRI67_08375 [Deltaproteobacteria bacterium]|nr:hypothetical protein [Deltaproteobacteria bacterium]
MPFYTKSQKAISYQLLGLLGVLLLYNVQMALANPIADVKVNGLDVEQEIFLGEEIDITIGLAPGMNPASEADYWLLHYSEADGFAYFDLFTMAWVQGFEPTFQGELLSFTSLKAPSTGLELDAGIHFFGFGVDLVRDGILTSDALYADISVVHVSSIFAFTHIPAYGNFQDLEGMVSGISPDDYGVLTYIMVEDVWWSKPFYNAPVTFIQADGTWTCDITTGGHDEYATEILSFLIPVDSVPVICGPCYEKPDIVGAVASAHYDRTPPPRTISFSGYDWEVKRRDFPAGPGPNFFSDATEAVWVDGEGLHLTINREGDRWYCTEVINKQSMGYGTYIFVTAGRVDLLDPNVVLGLFTWDTEAYEENYREIDIEFASWGDLFMETNAQFVVQPCSNCPGCSSCSRFKAELNDQAISLTNYIVWSPGSVEFRTYRGRYVENTPPASALVHEWTCSGDGMIWGTELV